MSLISGSLRLWLGLFAISLCGQASAAPAYVTGWPKQVQVEKPDPVLGDKLFWEHWVYSESFAKRFKGFPAAKTDPELKGSGLEAMALRIFKKNFWQELNPNYPEQYACEIDVYFDSTISLPFSESRKPRKVFPAYPHGITASYLQLEPYAEEDKVAIRASQPVRFSLKAQPLIFAAPLDGRFAQFGVREYRPSLITGMSVITLLSGFECAVTAPLQKGGEHWLSLLGERPWDKTQGGPPKAVYGQYDRSINLGFNPNANSESKSHLRVPGAFNNAALPKATLIKAMNWCIRHRHSQSDWRVNGQTISWQQMMQRCEEAERHGRILPDPRYYPGKEGLQDAGY